MGGDRHTATLNNLPARSYGPLPVDYIPRFPATMRRNASRTYGSRQPRSIRSGRRATALMLLVAITQAAISPVLTAAHAVRTGENVKRTFGERYYSVAEIAQGP